MKPVERAALILTWLVVVVSFGLVVMGVVLLAGGGRSDSDHRTDSVPLLLGLAFLMQTVPRLAHARRLIALVFTALGLVLLVTAVVLLLVSSH